MSTQQETPPGFKKYAMVVTPQGRLLMPPSCSVVVLDVFTQREWEAAMAGDARLDDTLARFGACDLAPFLAGLAPGRAGGDLDLARIEAQVSSGDDKFTDELLDVDVPRMTAEIRRLRSLLAVAGLADEMRR